MILNIDTFILLPFRLEVHLRGRPRNNLVGLQSDSIGVRTLFSGTDEDKILQGLSFLIPEKINPEVATCWPLDDVRVQMADLRSCWSLYGHRHIRSY